MARTTTLLVTVAIACTACRSRGSPDPAEVTPPGELPSVILDPTGADPDPPAVFIDGVQVDRGVVTGAMGCLNPDDIEQIEVRIGPDDPSPGEIHVTMKAGRGYDPEAPC